MLESVSLASLILALQLPLLLAATLMLALTPACDLGHLTLVRRPYLGWWDMCRVSRKMVSVSG